VQTLRPWRDTEFVALDLETTGRYPLESEICEVAALRYLNGQVTGQFQSFIKPTRPMGDAVIAIHHITNEMVGSAPTVSEVIPEFHKFLSSAVIIAHHAPFDMGFLANEFEKLRLPLSSADSLCTAIISRKALPESPNHRLQTLVTHLGLKPGQAHRALDDAQSCLDVAVKCFERIGEAATLNDLYKFQQSTIRWLDYSLDALKEKEAFMQIIKAIEQRRNVELVYMGGSRPGKSRELTPIGLVRNPNGDFLVAREPEEPQTKRFFLSQILSARGI
jgi:DNA polymerase III subunit epsilon